MYDVMRQYITENFNMHLRCLLELFLRRKTAKNLHKTFELHATMMEQLLTQLEVMTSANTKMYIEHIVRWLQGRPVTLTLPARTPTFLKKSSAPGCVTLAPRLSRVFPTCRTTTARISTN